MKRVLVIETCLRFLESELVGNPQLLAQFTQMTVTGEDGMIETVNLCSIFQNKGTSQTTQNRRRLINSDRYSLLCKEVSQADAHDTAADNSNFLF